MIVQHDASVERVAEQLPDNILGMGDNGNRQIHAIWIQQTFIKSQQSRMNRFANRIELQISTWSREMLI